MASSRILVIGGTGRLGLHLVTASLDAGHPTAVLVRRPATAGARADSPVKAKLIEELCDNGARLVYGDVNDHDILVAAIKNADVVICAVGHTTPHKLVENQLKIMEAIRDAGNVKRFVPSECGASGADAGASKKHPGSQASSPRSSESFRDSSHHRMRLSGSWLPAAQGRKP
ncbi:hypothetical protein OsI_01072 [Oryza sativa Indica Group]|uniref:NmrA-like domain-containing protein n=1 Tax=Oryza sativa subsp. indica TaxID=39946 RepID=B8ABG4_ORYSI|nr:hypothetical protein OsI_01072 [Oryza sativa Indica Group]